MSGTKVWTVMIESNEDTFILGVYSSMSLAREARAKYIVDQFDYNEDISQWRITIREFDIDETND